MKYLVWKDRKVRSKFLNREWKYLGNMLLYMNGYLNGSIGAVVQDNLNNLGVSIVKVNNRCIRTGRVWGVINDFKVSWMELKRLMKTGMLEGVRKIIW